MGKGNNPKVKSQRRTKKLKRGGGRKTDMAHARVAEIRMIDFIN